MPAVSRAQKRFMDAAAHNPEFAKKAGVPQKVAKDFSEASKGKCKDLPERKKTRAEKRGYKNG